MRFGCICIVAALAFSAAVSKADEIYFKNGDVLTGKITGISAGKIAITTASAGDVSVPVAGVSTFSTDAPLDLKLSDGSIVRGKLSSSTEGQVISKPAAFASTPLKIASIQSFPADLAAAWTGSIKFGGLLIRGNTNSESLSLSIAIDRKTEKDELSFTGDYLYGRSRDRISGLSTTTEDNWQLEAKYQYNFTKKLYGYLDVQIQKDRLAFLDLRVFPSAGLGYHWIDRPDLAFATEAGIGWVYENYTNNTPTREDVSVQLAYHFVKKFNDKVTVLHNLKYTPSIENSRNFLAETDVELRSMLSKHWFTDLKIQLDYDSNPANGALKTNTRYELGLGFTL